MEETVIRRIHALRQMSVAELRCEWQKLYGEPARSKHRDFLWRRLAWRVQELAHGGLSADATARLRELEPEVLLHTKSPREATRPAREPNPRPVRDLRLPTPGTIISRSYKGRELRLVVRQDGFELDGQMFRSLSEAARHVTGARWNGRLFWGLVERKRRT